MRDIIVKFLRDRGICSILRKEETKGMINTFLLDFLGNDDRYYSFFAMYNMTQIFTRVEENLIDYTTQYNTLDSRLKSNLLSFDTQKAYVEGKWEIQRHGLNEDVFSRCLTEAADNLFSRRHCGDFEITKVLIETRLFLGIIVYFTYKGIYQSPIVYNLCASNHNRLELSKTDAKDLIDLFEYAGLNDMIWECV